MLLYTCGRWWPNNRPCLRRAVSLPCPPPPPSKTGPTKPAAPPRLGIRRRRRVTTCGSPSSAMAYIFVTDLPTHLWSPIYNSSRPIIFYYFDRAGKKIANLWSKKITASYYLHNVFCISLVVVNKLNNPVQFFWRRLLCLVARKSAEVLIW